MGESCSHIEIKTNDKDLIEYYSLKIKDGFYIQSKHYTIINYSYLTQGEMFFIACPTVQYNKINKD